MSYRHLEESSSVDGTSESPPEFDQTLADVDSEQETWTSEHPLGDEIGRILKMIGLALAAMFVISFIIIPSTVAIVLCCCQESPASGDRSKSYSTLSQTTYDNIYSGRDYPERPSGGASCRKIYLIGLLFGIPAGIVVGIIAGVNTWSHL